MSSKTPNFFISNPPEMHFLKSSLFIMFAYIPDPILTTSNLPREIQSTWSFLLKELFSVN